MAGANVTLTPDKLMLNPKFDGYKLSLESMPTYQMALTEEVDLVDVDKNDYNFQHIRWFALFNHLVLDKWNRNNLYYVDKCWNVRQVCVQDEGKFQYEINTVFKIPDHAEYTSKTRFNVTLNLMDDNYATLTDGAGRMFIIHTGDRRSQQSQQWQVEYSHCVSKDGSLCSLLDATYHTENEIDIYNCLLLETDIGTVSTEKSPVFLLWLTLQKSKSNQIEIVRSRQLEGMATPEYACFDKSKEGLSIAAVKPFRFVTDSCKPVELEDTPAAENAEAKDLPAYSWIQTSKDVTVIFKIDGSFDKTDIDFNLSLSALKVGLKNGTVFLDGELGGAVDTQGSTWLIDENKLEIILIKSDQSEGERGSWESLIVGDDRGEQVMDADYVAEAHERLEYLTSTTRGDKVPQGDTEPFNAQQLEDCDIYPDASSTLARLDGETHRSSHIASLASHQLLFTAIIDPNDPPTLCLRFDVDGLMWQPALISVNGQPWSHVGTFNAFAYVHAGKENKKFTSCSPDLSYVAMSDCTRYVYVYRQQDGVSLLNRKSRESVQISKQLVCTIDSVDNIIGMRCSNNWLFVLTKKTMFALRIDV